MKRSLHCNFITTYTGLPVIIRKLNRYYLVTSYNTIMLCGMWVIGLLTGQEIIITADREFHSIFLSHWLKKYQKLDVYFVFRQKKSTMIKRGKKYCNLSELKVNISETKLFLNQKITKILKVKTYNLLVYKKH